MRWQLGGPAQQLLPAHLPCCWSCSISRQVAARCCRFLGELCRRPLEPARMRACRQAPSGLSKGRGCWVPLHQVACRWQWLTAAHEWDCALRQACAGLHVWVSAERQAGCGTAERTMQLQLLGHRGPGGKAGPAVGLAWPVDQQQVQGLDVQRAQDALKGGRHFARPCLQQLLQPGRGLPAVHSQQVRQPASLAASGSASATL